MDRERRDGMLGLRIRDDPTAFVISLRGELDLANVKSLEAAFEEGCDGPSREVVIDLRELEFIDSTGIAAIVKIAQREADGGRVRFIRSERPQVCHLLERTGVAQWLPLD